MKYEKIPRYLVARTTLVDYFCEKISEKRRGLAFFSCRVSRRGRKKKKKKTVATILFPTTSNLPRDWSLQINTL